MTCIVGRASLERGVKIDPWSAYERALDESYILAPPDWNSVTLVVWVLAKFSRKGKKRRHCPAYRSIILRLLATSKTKQNKQTNEQTDIKKQPRKQVLFLHVRAFCFSFTATLCRPILCARTCECFCTCACVFRMSRSIEETTWQCWPMRVCVFILSSCISIRIRMSFGHIEILLLRSLFHFWRRGPLKSSHDYMFTFFRTRFLQLSIITYTDDPLQSRQIKSVYFTF